MGGLIANQLPYSMQKAVQYWPNCPGNQPPCMLQGFSNGASEARTHPKITNETTATSQTSTAHQKNLQCVTEAWPRLSMFFPHPTYYIPTQAPK